MLRTGSILSLRFLLSLLGFKHFSLPFQDAFHLSLTVLLRYRSWEIFRLGGRNPPSSRGKTKSRYSGTSAIGPLAYGYGTITLSGIAFQKFSPSPAGPARSPHSTSPRRSPPRIRFGLFRFRSPLLTESRLLSFPPLIRMFWLSGFPLPDGSCTVLPVQGSPIRGSPDQRLHAATRGLSQLVTPFISPHAEISTKQRGRIES